MNEQSDLSSLLSQVTLNTPVEVLSTQLEKTLISSTRSIPTSSFTLQTETSHMNNNNNDVKIPLINDSLNKHMDQQQQQELWTNNNNNVNNNNHDDDGWGEAPSYTSILPYVEFGFTSNITLSQSSPVNHHLLNDSTVNINPNQPFSRFKNTPITFNSNPN
ncbi:unnamed protein product [Cunninghamella blakesleeana]